jgi:predicted RNA polymerase sigma factor
VALTLRLLGGLTTPEIARAFLVPEPTVGQRISRAKASIKAAGATFDLPAAEEPERLRVVLHVLYLLFNEGYTTSSGPDLLRADLTAEAIRLTREVHRLRPDDGEVAGLLALMVLTDARRAARTAPDGGLVPLHEQDRSRGDPTNIEEGVAIITDALSRTALGPYQLLAAFAAVHDEAPTPEATDWEEVLALYGLLERLAPSPVVTLNRAVAVAEVHGAEAALALLASLDDERITGHHRFHAVRAHLLERTGDLAAARTAYLEARARTTNLPEQRYLTARAARL